jgi:branched-chain amino acid transport system substrate-binding protein
MGFTRRDILRASVAGAFATGATALPTQLLAANKTVKIGMNIPMTGDYAPWGLPGLYGCEIVANNINTAGGVKIGGDTYNIEMVAYDHGYDTEKAVQGYKKLVLQDEVKMVMMLGGSTSKDADHDLATE